jgi:hypothetical protein
MQTWLKLNKILWDFTYLYANGPWNGLALNPPIGKNSMKWIERASFD